MLQTLDKKNRVNQLPDNKTSICRANSCQFVTLSIKHSFNVGKIKIVAQKRNDCLTTIFQKLFLSIIYGKQVLVRSDFSTAKENMVVRDGTIF